MSSEKDREKPGRRVRFEALYEEHFDALLAYALRRTDRETAYDAIGKTFLAVWRRLEDVPEDALPSQYRPEADESTRRRANSVSIQSSR